MSVFEPGTEDLEVAAAEFDDQLAAAKQALREIAEEAEAQLEGASGDEALTLETARDVTERLGEWARAALAKLDQQPLG